MEQNNLQAEALRRVPAPRNDTAATKSSRIFGMLAAAAARCDGALRLALRRSLGLVDVRRPPNVIYGTSIGPETGCLKQNARLP
jgi:hypothetical protein